MMKTIVLANQKGGCAKTSTTHALGIGLANRGYKVLLADLDAQCNLCDYCGVDTENASATLYNVFHGQATIQDAILNIRLGVDLLLGDLLFTKADSEFVQIGRETMLKKTLGTIQDRYDYCIIDTAPSLGILLANALAAADGVIIPLTASRFSLKGMNQLSRFIDEIREDRNPTLKINGVLLTRFNKRTVLNRLLLDEVQQSAEQLGTKLYKTTIRQSIVMDESQVMQEDIYSQNSSIAEDYNNFVDEFLEDEHGDK